MEQWVELYKQDDYRIIGQDIIYNIIRVSTVWVGRDMGILSPLPIIFETMTFSEIEEYDGLQYRYATEDGAKLRHMELCEELTATLRERDKK